MKAAKAGKMLKKIGKAYLYKNLFQGASKFLVSQFNDFDYSKYANRKYLLKKAGVKERSFFGGLSLLFFGAAAGAVAGLLFAPKAGSEIRPLIKDKAMSFINEYGSESTQAPASA